LHSSGSVIPPYCANRKRAKPGQFDQHVYRLEELDELKEAVREKIIDHLAATRVRRSAQLLAIG
jgi:hypothetical protein